MNRTISRGIIAMGASAGGAPVIEEILRNVKNNLPAAVIVIHMPGEYTSSYADRLNRNSHMSVKEAEHGDILYKGCAFVAPGGRHMYVEEHNGRYRIALNDDRRVNGFRPSIDVLFYSVARCRALKKTGIILSGMGSDGVEGLEAIKEAGGETLAQDESSSAVFGMPRIAIEREAAMRAVDIKTITDFLNSIGKDTIDES